MLWLLTLWFRYGGEAGVEAALLEGFDAVDIDMWLLVIPQIIARINASNISVRKSVHALLRRVGRQHPQALIYPLAVASHEARHAAPAENTPASTRGRWAESILQSMRPHCDTLVEQALLVSNELIRVAILWAEMWHEALELAYRRYFYHEARGVEPMLSVLLPLYRLLDGGASTANEAAFVGAHAAELHAALAHCREFKVTGAEPELQCAWERFYSVLRHLARELHEARTLQLNNVSPALLEAPSSSSPSPGRTAPTARWWRSGASPGDQGDVVEAAAAASRRAGLRRRRVHLPAQGARGPAAGRARDAALRAGEHAARRVRGLRAARPRRSSGTRSCRSRPTPG